MKPEEQPSIGDDEINVNRRTVCLWNEAA